MIPGYLIKQAVRLLDAVPDSEDPVVEVNFDDCNETIEVWYMLADNEYKLATVKYDN